MFKFTTLDLTVLAFAMVVFLGGIVSVSPNESSKLSYMLIAMLCSYFAVSNLLRTAEWIKKCCSALILSFTISLAAPVIGNAVQLLPVRMGEIFNEMFLDSVLSLFGTNQIFIHMAVAVVPLLLIRAASSKSVPKTTWAVITAMLTLITLFIGGSRSGTFAIIIGIAILLMLVSKKSLSYIIPAIIIIPLIIALLPSSVTSMVNKLFSFDGTIASYRQTVSFTTNKMIVDSFFGGIGLGESAFVKTYPLYTNDLSLQITHTSSLYSQILVSLGISGLIVLLIFIIMLLRKYFSYIVQSRDDDPDIKNAVVATFTGLSALLIMGFIDHIWLSPSVFLMFWLIAALFSGSIRTAESERYSLPCDEPTLEIDCKTLNHFSKRKG